MEKRRLRHRRHRRRAELIAEWRAGIDALRSAEAAASPRFPFPGHGDNPGSYIVVDDGRPDAPETRGSRQDWYRTLHLYLSRGARRTLHELERKQVKDRYGKIPDTLGVEVARIERDWKLI